MCKDIVRDVLRFEAISALMRAEEIDIKDKDEVIASLKGTVAAKANIECYLRMIDAEGRSID